MASQFPPYITPFQLLELNIISAQELCCISRSMKTYAIAWVHSDSKLSTRVDPQGHANPTWNDKFVFRVDDVFLQNELSAVMIEIYATRWWRDVLVGTVRVLLGDLIPSSRSKLSTLGKHQLGMKFVALQVRRPSGRPQGILNIGVGVLDSSMRSMPLYSQLSSSAVGYRDLIGEDDPLRHHNNNCNQQKHQIIQNYHQHESLVQRPELRRTKSDWSSMVFDQPKRSANVDFGKNVGYMKPKKGKASSWVSGSTSEFGKVNGKMKKKNASSMISGASNKNVNDDIIEEDGEKNENVNKQAPVALTTKIGNANVSSKPTPNANPPKGIICKPQLKREPSMKRVTLGEPVIIKEPVLTENLEEPPKLATRKNTNEEGKSAELNKENKNERGEKVEEIELSRNGGMPKAKADKNTPPRTTEYDGGKKAAKETPISPPSKKLVPPPPPPPPEYTPLQKIDIESKKLQQPFDMMLLKPYNITDSELGPSASEVVATIMTKEQHKKKNYHEGSMYSGWSLDSSVEGLQSKLDRWRTELPTVYDKSEYASYVSDDVVLRSKPNSNLHKRRRHAFDERDQGAVSCFSNICGIQCTIVCGAKAKSAKNRSAKRRGRLKSKPFDDDSVLFY